jgi:hypothetical protein
MIYGFAEGPWQGKRFCAELVKQGFRMVDDPREADLVIAHSGGCFLLPRPKAGQLTVLMNPPYWPGKPLIISSLQSLWWNAESFAKRGAFSFWLKKVFWNTWYIFRYPAKSRWIVRHARRDSLRLAISQRRTAIVRSNNDVWLTPDAVRTIGEHADFTYRELPGIHDDCWLHPLPYIEVIKSIYDTR